MSAFAGGGENPKSIITLYINCHGIDMPETKITLDLSVRILSQAGKFGCWGFGNKIEPTKVKAWITSLKNKTKDETKDKTKEISTYSILEKINILFEIATARDIFNPEKHITAEDKIQLEKGKKTINLRQSRHTEKVIKEYKDWQIYTPIFDHLYDFNNKNFANQGIFIVDMKNKPESFKYNVDDDLSLKENYLKEEFKEMHILEFFLTHLVLEDHVDPVKVIDELDKLSIYSLNDYWNALKYTDSKNILITILGESIFYKINKIIEEKYAHLEHHSEILQSVLINHLKDKGFDVINIIDKSCRAHNKFMSKEKFAEINAKEDHFSTLIDKTLGGKKRKKTRKRRRNFKRKTRIAK